MRIAALCAGLALALAGCGGDTAEEPEASEAAAVRDLTGAALGAGDEEFGFGITAYPGAEVTSNRMMASSGQAAIRSDDPPEEVFAYYREQAEEMGFTLESEEMGEDAGSLAFERGEEAFSVMGGADPVGEGYNYSIGWEEG